MRERSSVDDSRFGATIALPDAGRKGATVPRVSRGLCLAVNPDPKAVSPLLPRCEGNAQFAVDVCAYQADEVLDDVRPGIARQILCSGGN